MDANEHGRYRVQSITSRYIYDYYKIYDTIYKNYRQLYIFIVLFNHNRKPYNPIYP